MLGVQIFSQGIGIEFETQTKYCAQYTNCVMLFLSLIWFALSNDSMFLEATFTTIDNIPLRIMYSTVHTHTYTHTTVRNDYIKRITK